MAYKKIVDDMVEDIIGGMYEADMKLPSDQTLVKRYGATRHDVRKAFELLTDMGYVYSIKGKGRYFKLKHDKIELLLEGDTSFTKKMTDKGYNLKTVNINFEEVKNTMLIMGKLGVDGSDRIFKIQRLRMIDDEPAAIHTSYVTDRLFKNIAEEGNEITSVFAYYKSKGYEKFYYKQSELQTHLPTLFERKVLDCPSLVPVLRLESQCLDRESDRLLEVTSIIYRGDRFICRIRP